MGSLLWIDARGVLTLSALLLVGCAPEDGVPTESIQPGNSAYTIFVADRVHTMDSEGTKVEAVGVRDGRIVGLGSLDEVTSGLATPPDRAPTRFEGKTILPGFVEPHLHPYLAGILLPMHFVTPHRWSLPGREVPRVRGADAFRQRLVGLAATEAPGAWLDVWGYHPLFHGPLDRVVLDELLPDRPVLVWHRSFHELYLNTMALETLGLLGVGAPAMGGAPGVEFERGRFFENGLLVAIQRLSPRLLAPERYLEGLREAVGIVHGGGITTVAEMSFGLLDPELELSLVRAAWGATETPFRTLLVPSGRSYADRGAQGHEGALEQVRREVRSDVSDQQAAAEPSSVSFLPDQVKLFADGAFYSQLMQLTEPGYLDGHHGEWLMTPEQLGAAAEVWWNGGHQIHVHANGDLGVDVTLDVLAGLLERAPRADHRFTLHHFGDSRAEQAARLAALGAEVSANPFYLWALGDAYSEVGLGPERAAHMVRSGSLRRAGVPLSFHSDFPMAPAQPLLLAWTAVVRRTSEGTLLGPDEAISVDDALRAITIQAARALRMENEIGSLEIGKRADFVILDADPYSVAPERLAEIGVWGTVLEGRVQRVSTGTPEPP